MDPNNLDRLAIEESDSRTSVALGGADCNNDFQNENFDRNSRRNSIIREDENREFDPFQVSLYFLMQN